MLGSRGASERTLTTIIAVLAIALVVAVFLWMRDREAKDVELQIGSRDVPVRAVPARVEAA